VKGVIGSILPLAIAVTISPIPIIAEILLLFTKKPVANAASYLAGFIVGVAGVLRSSPPLPQRSTCPLVRGRREGPRFFSWRWGSCCWPPRCASSAAGQSRARRRRCRSG